MIDRVVDRDPVYWIIQGKKKQRITKEFDKVMYKILCNKLKKDNETINGTLRLLSSLNFANGSKIILRSGRK